MLGMRSERQWQKRYAQWEKEELARGELGQHGVDLHDLLHTYRFVPSWEW